MAMFRSVYILVLCIFVLSPTLSAEAQGQVNGQVMVLEAPLLVREKPFANSTPIGLLESNALIIVLGRSADNLWLQTTASNGLVGWVNTEYIRVVQDLPNLPITHERNIIGMTPELSPEVTEHIQLIYRLGLASGNRPDAFSKVGDSISASPHAFEPIGNGTYHLGGFQYLQATIDQFSGELADGENSFLRQSYAAEIGWSASVVLNPRFAYKQGCMENESPLNCEYRHNHPSFALIMFGTNDVGHVTQSAFYTHLDEIIRITIEQNIIPIISTIPPRLDYQEKTTAFNETIVELATIHQIPLWDYGSAMSSLPDSGLDVDGIHPSIPPLGMRGSADFRTYNLPYGYVLRNLTALQMLDAVLRALEDQ